MPPYHSTPRPVRAPASAAADQTLHLAFPRTPGGGLALGMDDWLADVDLSAELEAGELLNAAEERRENYENGKGGEWVMDSPVWDAVGEEEDAGVGSQEHDEQHPSTYPPAVLPAATVSALHPAHENAVASSSCSRTPNGPALAEAAPAGGRTQSARAQRATSSSRTTVAMPPPPMPERATRSTHSTTSLSLRPERAVVESSQETQLSAAAPPSGPSTRARTSRSPEVGLTPPRPSKIRRASALPLRQPRLSSVLEPTQVTERAAAVVPRRARASLLPSKASLSRAAVPTTTSGTSTHPSVLVVPKRRTSAAVTSHPEAPEVPAQQSAAEVDQHPSTTDAQAPPELTYPDVVTQPPSPLVPARGPSPPSPAPVPPVAATSTAQPALTEAAFVQHRRTTSETALSFFSKYLARNADSRSVPAVEVTRPTSPLCTRPSPPPAASTSSRTPSSRASAKRARSHSRSPPPIKRVRESTAGASGSSSSGASSRAPLSEKALGLENRPSSTVVRSTDARVDLKGKGRARPDPGREPARPPAKSVATAHRERRITKPQPFVFHPLAARSAPPPLRAPPKPDKPAGYVPPFAATHAALALSAEQRAVTRAAARARELAEREAEAAARPLFAHVGERMRAHAEFDAAVRAKEALRERARAEEERARRRREEDAIREERRRTVIRAHPVPEMYRRGPLA